MTAAAPASATARVSDRIAAKPAAETPTMIGNAVRRITRVAKPTASSASSFCASPMIPRMVIPSTPALS